MRKIKFKVWDKELKMFLSNPFKSGLRFELNAGNLYLNGTNVSAYYVLCQYTGLKDRGGVEIYEGDVVEFENPVGAPVQIAKVEWSILSHGWVLYDWGVVFRPPTRQQMQVIGNIYENPDLIT